MSGFVQPATYWAVVSPPNERSNRRYIDYGTLSYTRKGAIERHSQYAVEDERAYWAKQRKRGWTAERVTITIAEPRP